MVLMLAHASFQDRVILSLGLGEDRSSPLTPLAVGFLGPRKGTARQALPQATSRVPRCGEMAGG